MGKSLGERRLIRVLVAVLGVWALYATTLEVLRWQWITPKIQEYRSKSEKVLPLFLEDQKALAEVRAIFRSPKQHDAGPFLNPIVVLTYTPEPTSPSRKELRKALDRFHQEVKPRRAPLILPKELEAQLGNPKVSYLERYREFNLKGLDFSWMAELEHYDHWNLFENFYFDYLENQTPSMYWEWPIPNFLNLRNWAKLRAIKGLQEDQVLPALKEIRHLAKLTYSTEILIGTMISGTILGIETQTYQFRQKLNADKTLTWQAIDEETTKKMIRVGRAFPGFASFGSHHHIIQKAFENEDYFGYCSALKEIVIVPNSLRLLLEESYAQHYQEMENLVRTKNCYLDPFNALWKTQRSSEDDLEIFFDSFQDYGEASIIRVLEKLIWIPPTKRFLGEWFLRVFDYWNCFSWYEETTK